MYWFFSTHGRPLLDWFSEIGSHLSEISRVASFISVVGWILAGLYQCYTIYKTKEVEGFSRWFLISWVVGDLSNVFGTYLTDQMFFQRFLSTCFLFLDGTLLAQYFYYTYIYYDQPKVYLAGNISSPPESTGIAVPSNVSATKGLDRRTPDDQYNGVASSSSPVSIKQRPISVSDILIAASASSSVASAAPVPSSAANAFTDAASQYIADNGTPISWILGTACGYVCSGLYFLSAVPQIIKNHQEKSTGTVSIYLFLADLIGNLGYSMSIIATGRDIADPVERNEFFYNEMPFLSGACLVFFLELYLMYQFYIYRGNHIYHHHRLGMDEYVPEEVESETTALITSTQTKGVSAKTKDYQAIVE